MPEFVEDISPMLKEARAEVQAVLDKHKIAGAVVLSSSTHAEFWLSLPEWSAVQLTEHEDQLALRIKSSSERDGQAHLEASMHLLLSLRDSSMNFAMGLVQLGDAAVKALEGEGMEVEHTTLQQKMRGEGGH